MKLSVDSLTTGLQFHGEVQGKRQHYYVLSSARQYFVMSLSLSKRDAGNFNLVSRSVVDRLQRRLRGRRGVGRRPGFTRSQERHRAAPPLAPLDQLYLLGAPGRAHLDPRREFAREIVFNAKP